MLKKSFILLTLLFALLFISTTTFAANTLDSAAQGVRNVVGGAENFVEGTVTGIGNGIRDGFDAMTDNNDATRNTDETNNTTGIMGTNNNNNNGNYGTTRTATTRTTANTSTGISNTMWTWFVLAILGIVIVSLVWYYAKQNVNTTHIRDDE